LSGVSIFPAENLRLSLLPHSHADRQAVSDYKLIDYERLLSIEEFEQFYPLFFDDEILLAVRWMRAVVLANEKQSQYGWRRIELWFAIENRK